MKLTKKQTVTLDILEDKITKETIFGGGAGGAKTALGCYWLLKMCLKYPETRWLMGRAKLKTLKETTLNTFYEICKMQGIKNGVHFKVNHQSSTIYFFNGSEILMKDLFFYPSDPNFDELGSLEITGGFIDECNQIHPLAWTVVKSRIRYKLDEYDLIPKLLGTCNPAKNWVYKDFYKLNKEGKLEPHKKFIQSLASDNPYISKHYMDNLRDLPKAQRDRLMLGLWESFDELCLMDYESIVNIFSNDFVKNDKGKYYITIDVARKGKDKAVITVWRGFEVIELVEYPISLINELQTSVIALRTKYNIPLTSIIADEDGVGGGLVDGMNINGFINNSTAINKENYANLKTQCYYKLAEMINKNEIYISAELSEKQKESIIEELEQVKASDVDVDGKLKIINKAEVKQAIGRSPDYSDALMMRMWFVLAQSRTRLTVR